LLAPTGTPATVINQMNTAFNSVLHDREIQAKLSSNFQPAGTSAEEFSNVIKRDMIVLTKIAKSAGIKEE